MISVQRHCIVSGTSVKHTAGVLDNYEKLDCVLVLLFWQGGGGWIDLSIHTSRHQGIRNQDSKENTFDGKTLTISVKIKLH